VLARGAVEQVGQLKVAVALGEDLVVHHVDGADGLALGGGIDLQPAGGQGLVDGLPLERAQRLIAAGAGVRVGLEWRLGEGGRRGEEQRRQRNAQEERKMGRGPSCLPAFLCNVSGLAQTNRRSTNSGLAASTAEGL
jgi:hypothetical protein